MIKIGIPLWKLGDNSFGSTLNYISFASRYGQVIPLMFDEPMRPDINLLLLPGGLDVDPSRYHKRPSFFTTKPDLFKEYFDVNILPDYINNETPILGICRGHQSLGVTLGGELIQHMNHETNPDNDGYKTMHDVRLVIDLPKLELHNNYTFGVNSRHHQIIKDNTLPKDVVPIARYYTKKYTAGKDAIEAIAHTYLPIVGVQWHPEDNYSHFIDKVIHHLIYQRTSII